MGSSVQLTSSGPILDTVSDYIKSLQANPPWKPINDFIQGVDAYVKSLQANPPWKPINDFIQGADSTKPSLQTIDTYFKQLESRLPPKVLANGELNQLAPYCGIVGSFAGSRLSAASSSKVPTIPAGVPVTLTALAPLPGASLPAVNNLAAGLLPPSTTVTFRWHISIATGSPPVQGATDARPGTTLDDVGGAFECVSGSLETPILDIIPWPDAAHNTTSIPGVVQPSTTVRTFAAYVDIAFWWPGLGDPTVVSTKPMFFAVQPWSEVFSGSADTTKGVWTWSHKTPDPPNASVFAHQFFGDLFDVAIDDVAPVAGKVINATISRADFKPVLPQTITSLVQRDPNLKIQAGLDVGAVLNSFKNIGNLITGSSDPNSAAFDSALSVSQVLSNALSIPIAVAVNGTDMAKTLIPNSPVTLPNMVSSQDGSALAGIVPVGKLMTRIESKLDDQHLSIADVDGILRSGLSFLPLPVFESLKSGVLQTGPTVHVSIELKANITVPGAAQPLQINYSVGSFDIRRPVIPLPQLALMFSAPLTGGGSQQNQDILIVPDPVTRSLFSSTDALKGAITSLGVTLSSLRNLLPTFPGLVNLMPGFDDVSNTVTLMIQQLNNAAANGKTLFLIGSYSHNDNFSPNEPKTISAELPVDRWWDGRNTDSADNNISAFLWIGAPDTQDYWMRIGLDDRKSTVGKLYMPPEAGIRNTVRFLSGSDMSGGVVFKDMSGNNEQPVENGGNVTWNDRVRWVEWAVDQVGTF